MPYFTPRKSPSDVSCLLMVFLNFILAIIPIQIGHCPNHCISPIRRKSYEGEGSLKERIQGQGINWAFISHINPFLLWHLQQLDRHVHLLTRIKTTVLKSPFWLSFGFLYRVDWLQMDLWGTMLPYLLRQLKQTLKPHWLLTHHLHCTPLKSHPGKDFLFVKLKQPSLPLPVMFHMFQPAGFGKTSLQH